jgi:hypothetical protein
MEFRTVAVAEEMMKSKQTLEGRDGGKETPWGTSSHVTSRRVFVLAGRRASGDEQTSRR